MLNWIPDRIMIPLQYRIHTGRRLDLKNPKRFTEKLQLYKLNYRNPLMLRCTDKFEVRSVVEEMGMGELLVPLIGCFNQVSDIDFNSLPNEFVAKTTDGGGGNQVFVCRDKSQTNCEEFFSILNEWMAAPKTKPAGREWAYENDFPRRIIIEELLSDKKHDDIPDYKFWCFNGEAKYCQVIGSRRTNETIDFFDMEWNHMPFRGLNKACENSTQRIEKPENFEELKLAASKLSEGFPFVRVDLYTTGEHSYFGELTFYPASGYGTFTPDTWDEHIGQLLESKEVGWGGVNS